MASPTELGEYLAVAIEAARAAGRQAMDHFRSDTLAVLRKDDGSEVTAADRDGEHLLRARIEAAFPDHGILGEEHGEKPGDGRHRWLLDPIDGTRAFAHGVPLFTVLVGLEIDGAATVGVIYAPAADELVAAAPGHGCTWNGRPTRTSPLEELAEASVVYTEGAHLERHEPTAWSNLRRATRLQRGWGDAFGHLLVATGRAELALDPRLQPWDAAALIPVIREAGGRFLTFAGDDASVDSGQGISVSGALAAPVRALLERSAADARDGGDA